MAQLHSKSKLNKKTWLAQLGPGLITGAADDDPSGIATYSQAGALFGLNMLWTVLFTYPLMVAIQIISARIGCVSGAGLGTNIRNHYPRWLLYSTASLLLVANTINIAADISAMGSAVQLVAGGSPQLYAALFGLISLLLQVFVPYTRYVRILKWLTLSLLAYVATVFAVHISWGEVFARTLMPNITWSTLYITTLVGVFGTTISPYLFYWQASQEVEDKKLSEPSSQKPQPIRSNFKRIKIDTTIGMGFSNLVAFFIILTTAVTLHTSGHSDIQTSADAAKALRPLAGDFAFYVFSLGIVGTGLLAIPVLAGSSAYAIAEAFDWKNRSLELNVLRAKRFYSIIILSTLLGIGLGFSRLDPIKALYFSAVVNGIISVPIMAIMMLLASDHRVMGRYIIGRKLRFAGWLTVFVMALAVLTLLLCL